MKDLILWQELRKEHPDEQLLEGLLLDLAQEPPTFRMPFLGFLDHILTHPNSALRAAAVRCLAGATGEPAFRGLLRALNDPDPEVQQAAVDALDCSTFKQFFAKWVHVLFHHNPNIRKAAAKCSLDHIKRSGYHTYLLYDPECHQLVEERFNEIHIEPHMLPFLLNALDEKQVTAERLRGKLTRLKPIKTFRNLFFLQQLPKGPLSYRHNLKDLVDGKTPNADIPLFLTKTGYQYLKLFYGWDAEDANCKKEEQLKALEGLCSEQHALAIQSEIIHIALLQQVWDQTFMNFCFSLHWRFITYPWIPLEVRRTALLSIYKNRTYYCFAHKIKNEKELTYALNSGIFHDEHGHLDLEAIGGLLFLANEQPYTMLLKCVAIGAIVDAALANHHSAIPFLCHQDEGGGRQYIFDQIIKKRAGLRPLLLAATVDQLSSLSTEMLEKYIPGDRKSLLQLLDYLLQSEVEYGKTLSDKKMARLGAIISHRFYAQITSGTSKFMDWLLKSDRPEQFKLGIEIFTILVKEEDTELFIGRAVKLPTEALRKLLKIVRFSPGFPYGKEVQLAIALEKHPKEDIREWAEARIPVQHTVPNLKPEYLKTIRKLDSQEVNSIATCPETDLDKTLEPLSYTAHLGLCEALAQRSPPTEANLTVCKTLMQSHDELHAIGHEFTRYGSEEGEFLEHLEMSIINVPHELLSITGNAFVHRFERHCFEFGRMLGQSGGLPAVLNQAFGLNSPILRNEIWEAAEHWLSILRYRDKPNYKDLITGSLLDTWITGLPTDVGRIAAKLLIDCYLSGMATAMFAEHRVKIEAAMPDYAPEVRKILSPWISCHGLKNAINIEYSHTFTSQEVIKQIQGITDLQALVDFCCGDNFDAAQEAALRMIELGEEALDLLANIILNETNNPAMLEALTSCIALWPKGNALNKVKKALLKGKVSDFVRFLCGLAIIEQGDLSMLEQTIHAVCRETDTHWFSLKHWKRFIEAGIDELTLSLALVESPHPHAHISAVERLVKTRKNNSDVAKALIAFLETDSQRYERMRIAAAQWLLAHGYDDGYTILVRQCFTSRSSEESEEDKESIDIDFHRFSRPLLDGMVHSVLHGTSSRMVEENRLMFVIRSLNMDYNIPIDEYLLLIIRKGHSSLLRSACLTEMSELPKRQALIRKLAETFYWGQKEGSILTGHNFTITHTEHDELGYTLLDQNNIFVSPMPLLNEEKNGLAITEALILHEIGHHLYHRGKQQQAVWTRARHMNLLPLLNLVADEHLERNLRAMDAAYGNRLKALSAYAFQHAQKDILVKDLLEMLGPRAFDVLSRISLRFSNKTYCIKVDCGEVLLEMEKQNGSFAGFMRVLRMGLGNRRNDPKVAQGLKLFTKSFRKSTMTELLDIAIKLHEIFGGEAVDALNLFAQDSTLYPDAEALERLGLDISPEEIEKEIKRIRNEEAKQIGKQQKDTDETDDTISQMFNLGSETSFVKINQIKAVQYDREAQQAYIDKIKRYARHLQKDLQHLGISHITQRMRISGNRIDNTRLRSLVTHGDPRLLISRRLQFQTDLFIGVLVDCSGSMCISNNLEKAKLFASLVSEGTRNLSGVDARFWGFTDDMIFDAGTSKRCAVHALETMGGNNDAAALWHAAMAAMHSTRISKLLIMISDGSPTECTVEALRTLVADLTRKKICCAQVAVAELREICFPHYILLDDEDFMSSVRQFGKTVSKLVMRSLNR